MSLHLLHQNSILTTYPIHQHTGCSHCKQDKEREQALRSSTRGGLSLSIACVIRLEQVNVLRVSLPRGY